MSEFHPLSLTRPFSSAGRRRRRAADLFNRERLTEITPQGGVGAPRGESK